MPPPATYLCEAVCKVVNKHMKRYTKDPMRFITDCKVKLGDICHEEVRRLTQPVCAAVTSSPPLPHLYSPQCVMLSALVQRLHSKGTVVSETQIGPYWPVSLQPLGKHIKCSQQDCERCLMQGICYPTCAVPNSC